MAKVDYIAELHEILEKERNGEISEVEASVCAFALGALHWADQLENAADAVKSEIPVKPS
jgi:hypothetical protein